MTERVGLVGWPVKHSVSPAMHNAAFEALGLDWQYDLLPVQPGQLASELPELIGQGYRGFNVTIPHKQAALQLAQTREQSAQAIGAANTISITKEDSLHASNTDWQGFADELRAHAVEAVGKSCLILGTGGSAQAVRYALHHMDAAMIQNVSRNPHGREDIIGYEELTQFVGAVREPPMLIINCTPVGMWPNVDASPWPDEVPIPQDAIVYDLVYNPLRTKLVAQAKAAGARAIGGLGMLVRQGAIAFEIWTKQAPSLNVMRAAAQDTLKLRS